MRCDACRTEKPRDAFPLVGNPGPLAHTCEDCLLPLPGMPEPVTRNTEPTRADYLRKQAQARAIAAKRLRDAYPAEWRLYLAEAKRTVGLTPGDHQKG